MSHQTDGWGLCFGALCNLAFDPFVRHHIAHERSGWIASQPQRRPRRDREFRLPQAERDALVEAHPWLRRFFPELMGEDAFGRIAARKRQGPAPPRQEEPVADQAADDAGDSDSDADAERVDRLDPAEYDAMMELFRQRREEWAAEDRTHEVDFYTFIRGGKYPIEHEGVPFNAVGAMARGGLPRQWAQVYNMPVMSSFQYSAHGDGAELLAAEFCRKCQYLYDIWFQRDAADYRYTAAEIDAYVEDPAFTMWANGNELSALTRNRVVQLRAMRPR